MKKNSTPDYGIVKLIETTNNRTILNIRLNNGIMLKYIDKTNRNGIRKNQRVRVYSTDKIVNRVTSLENETTDGTISLFLPEGRMLIVTVNGETLECNDISTEFSLYDKVKCSAASFPEDEEAEYGKAQDIEVIPIKKVDAWLADKICCAISERFGYSPISLAEFEELLEILDIDPKSYGFSDSVALFLEQFPDKLHVDYEKNTVCLADTSQIIDMYKQADKYIKAQGYKSMTLLQKRVFSDPCFWNRNRFLIAGSTSSGKTAIPITKYLIRRENSERRQTMLIAVPLRALATQMQQGMINRLKDIDLDIVISTSEYVDRDDDIINGNVDIAIVIYEKIFIFCSEHERFFDNFDIVVLDELSIYRSKERGIKAEVVTLKLREENYSGELILLGTPYGKWQNQIKKYNLYTIKVFSRPVSIHEFFFKNIVSDTYMKSSYRLYSRTGQRIEAGFHSEFENSLIQLCKQEYLLGHKCIVFKFSQAQTRSMATRIYGELAKRLHFDYQSDDEVKAFKRRYLKHYKIANEEIAGIYDEIDEFRALMNGVAFHNASLPESMRIALEKELLGKPEVINGGIKLVFATETIAYGLNSNVDTVVMTGMTKNEGKNTHDILRDDYQNCIGRAGRLGYLNYGTSYAFLQDDTISIPGSKQMDSIDYYRSGVKTDMNVKGHLVDVVRNNDVDRFIFYCLSLCPSCGVFTSEEMVEILNHATNYRDANKGHQELCNLIDSTFSCMEDEHLIYRLDEEEVYCNISTEYYRLTSSGKKLKGCVLYRDSFKKIKEIFSEMQKSDNIYFFNLFYEFCNLREIIEYCSEIVPSLDLSLVGKALQNRKEMIDNEVKSVIMLSEYFMPIALEEKLVSQELANELMQSEIFTTFRELRDKDCSVLDDIENEDITFFNRLKLALVSTMWLKGYSLSLINSISGSRSGKLDNIRRKIGEKMSYLIDTCISGSTVFGLQEDKIPLMKRASLSMYYGIDIELLTKNEISEIIPEKALWFHFASMYITKYKYLKTIEDVDWQDFWDQVEDLDEHIKEIIIQEGVIYE